MTIRTHLKRTLLSSAFLAGPVILFAAESPSQPVGSDSQLRAPESGFSLRQVPLEQSQTVAIQQVQYRADGNGQNSTVHAELQQMFRRNGQPMPSMQPRQLPNAQSPNIRLVQHDQAQQSAGQRSGNHGTSRPKKPGLFRRWFGKLSSNDEETSAGPVKGKATSRGKITADNDNPYLNSGEQVPQLPPPPPITYQTQNSTVGNSTPAQRTGYQQTPQQLQAGAQNQQQRQNEVRPLIQQPYHEPVAHQDLNRPDQSTQKRSGSITRNDGFIDPFGGQELTQQEETVLDLDSLIDGSEATPLGAQNQLDQSFEEAEELLPEIAVAPKATASSAPQSSGNGPFTGYRLQKEEKTVVRPQVAPGPSIQPAREAVPMVVTPKQEALEDTLDLTVPLIEETVVEEAVSNEAFQLPAVETSVEPVRTEENRFEKVPLLDIDDSPTVAEPAPTVREELPAIRTPTPPGSDRIKALDSRAQQEQQRYRIMARTGKVGFKGFCPVTLRDQRELTDSREEYKAKFGLQTYYFASPEAKSAFEGNPSRYAPAAGGSDVVLLVNTGEETSGTLDFSLWYRDRLYMFRSRETQAIFSKDPTRYASQY